MKTMIIIVKKHRYESIKKAVNILIRTLTAIIFTLILYQNYRAAPAIHS